MNASPAPGLQEIIEGLRARSENLPPALAGLREDMVTPAAFAADIPRIEAWLDTQCIAAPGMDRKAAAAYMVGGMAWSVCIWIAALHLTGNKPIRRVAFAQERYWWGEGTPEAHEYVRYPISLETGEGEPDFRATIERIFEPIVAATMLASGLSAGALWRLVADNVANGFLWAGKPLGDVERAVGIATGILGDGRLNNGKTGFVRVTSGEACDWFLVRGGCCRYYTTAGMSREDYCTSCVMRDRADQVARYTDYLASLQSLD